MDNYRIFCRIMFSFSLKTSVIFNSSIPFIFIFSDNKQEYTCTLEQSHLNILYNYNGVRQEGVLSPTLFSCYINRLLKRLKNSGCGC